MLDAIYLPRLNNLTPTLESTLIKIVEEAGELARAVLKFLPYEHYSVAQIVNDPTAKAGLAEVSAELLDVAQTCVTMIFVFEGLPQFEYYGVSQLITDHLHKLEIKGYSFDTAGSYQIKTINNYKYLVLPRLDIHNITLLTTVCKIQEELGELAQYLGKLSGSSGEKTVLSTQEVIVGCAEELLDVAQCCFTLVYLLARKFDVDVGELIDNHITKLKVKGYIIV